MAIRTRKFFLGDRVPRNDAPNTVPRRPWLFDELFWRDVTSRTISGLLVVLITSVVAGATGLIDFRLAGHVILIGLLFVGTLAVTLLIARAVWGLVEDRLNRSRVDDLAGFIWWLLSGVALLVVALAVSGVALWAYVALIR